MHNDKALKGTVDYPQKEELVTSPVYAIRITVPAEAEKVEVSLDRSPWQACRQSAGYWWYDWSGYVSGEHEAAVRVHPSQGKSYTLPKRRFEVRLDRLAEGKALTPKLTVTQFSVLVPNEPGTLAQVTQLLLNEEVRINGLRTVNLGDKASIQFLAGKRTGLRRKLEDAGFLVVENEVFHLQLPKRCAELDRLAQCLAEQQINILSLYGAGDGENIRFVLSVDRTQEAAKLMAHLGVQAVPA